MLTIAFVVVAAQRSKICAHKAGKLEGDIHTGFGNSDAWKGGSDSPNIDPEPKLGDFRPRVVGGQCLGSEDKEVPGSTCPAPAGSTAKCIKTDDGNWLTLQEFQAAGGYKSSRNWKTNVRCGGKTLKRLMEVFQWWAGGVTSLVVVKHKVTHWLTTQYMLSYL